MAPASSKDAAAVGKRPSPLRLTSSSGRTEVTGKSSKPASNSNTTSTSTSTTFKPPPPKRASTAPHSTPPKDKDASRQKQINIMASQNEKKSKAAAAQADGADTFDTQEDNDDPPEPPRASVDMEDLPIELIGLTDNFIESLSAKVHPTPPNIDNLSRKFQDFYFTASTHIGTHIATLASRQNRERSPAPTNTTRASAASLFRAKAASISISGRDTRTPPPHPPKTEAEQQMITSEELANRKRARRALEQKRSLLEEAVERRLCEGIYDRIYRHRTTQDEAQDDKLRSKTAALDVVGIGPADLGVDLGEPASAPPEAIALKQKEVREWLEPARKEIALMGQTHYPLGKLNHLKSAHKGIVDTLSHFHPSSSADEIMPMLIYTLITLPPQQLNVVSDLNFIQRFRWETKIEGEAAYCLTNLEASISFLDTVDLSTLRADEAPSGPVKAAPGPETPKTETFPPYFEQKITVSAATPTNPELSPSQATAASIKPAPSPTSGLRAAVQLRNRRLSDLVNTPAQALGAAGGAVINTFNAADHSFKTSLEGSYRLFFGRMSQQQQQAAAAAAAAQGDGSAAAGFVGGVDGTGKTPADVLLPKTLDEARKLIATPPPGSEDESSVNGDEHPSTQTHPPHIAPPRIITPPPANQKDTKEEKPRRLTLTREERLLSLVGGRKTSVSRDPSADSTRSAASSSRRVAFAADDDAASTSGETTASTSGTNNPALMDSVRNLGSSLNPISRLGGFRGFGRAQSTPAVQTTDKPVDGGDLGTAFPEIAAALPPKAHIAPPVKRFMELHNPADLRISEVLELLRDYRRLAKALSDMGAFNK